MKNVCVDQPIIAKIQPQCDGFCKRVREAKKAQGKTTQDIADATGIPLSNISKFFSGKLANPSIYNAAAVAIYLGISIDEAFGLKANQDSQQSERSSELEAQVHDLEKDLNYCRKDIEHLEVSLRSRKLIITVLFGICVLLIASLFIGIIYDSSLPDEGFIHNTHVATISIFLITVIVVAIAVTVLIMARYLYKKREKG